MSIDKNKLQQAFKNTIDYDELLNCTRCGFCLPSCPTYTQTGEDEVHSPRGRIALMKGVIDGIIEPNEEVLHSIDLCLGCRACESACPSGVKFGQLLEQAREAINQTQEFSLVNRLTRKVIFKGVFPHQTRLINVAGLTRLYQKSGLQYIMRKSGIINFLPDGLSAMESILPNIPKRKQMLHRPNQLPAISEQIKKVAFFSGCLMDTLFLSTNDATIKLLQLMGCEVIIPQTQNCCGALHAHSGERNQAKEMAKKNIIAFEKGKVDYIITNAGGCGAFLYDYTSLFKGDNEWEERALNFSEKIKDISSILLDMNFDKMNLHADEQVITYQDSCHLKNGQNIANEPRTLIKSVEGVTFIEMPDADQCCGSAGIYNIVEHEMSMKILDNKMEQTKKTQPNTIVTSNPGCFMQMKLGVKREGLEKEIRVMHLADFLLECIRD